MMRLYARLRGLRRLLISVPVLTPRLSGLWLGLVAPAQARVGRPLVEGLKNATVVRDPGARAAFAIDPMPLRAGVRPRHRRRRRRVEQGRRPRGGRRRLAGAGLRAHPTHRRGQRLVFGRPALARPRLARSPHRRARHAPRAAVPVRTAPSATSSTTGRSRPTSAIGAFASPPISASPAAAGSSSRSRRSTADGDPASVRSPRSTRVASSGGSTGMPSIRSTPSSSAGCCASWRAAPRPPSRTRRRALERRRPASSPASRRHAGSAGAARPSAPSQAASRVYTAARVRSRRLRIPFHGPSWPPWCSCWISSGRPLRSSSSSPSWPGRGRSPSAAICCGSGRPAT